MNKWLGKLEAAMAASAFAEAGEFETARETLHEGRKILLALKGAESDRNAFRYALNMCNRMDAKLEILHITPIPSDLLREFKSELRKENIEYLFIKKNGSLEEEIRNYSGMKENVLFVVVEVSEGVDIHSKRSEKIISNAWKNLKCPLVVVSQGNTAFA